MRNAVADTQCYPSKVALTRPCPLLEASIRDLFCPEQEIGLCSASLGLTTLVSALFKVLVSPSAPAGEKGSHLASCQRPLLLDAALPVPPAPACSAQGGRLGYRRPLSLGSGQATQERSAGKCLAQQPGRVGRRVQGGVGTSWGLGEAAQTPLIPGAHSAPWLVLWQAWWDGPFPTLPIPGQPSSSSSPLSKWVILQLLAPPPRWQLLCERSERSQGLWLQLLAVAMTRDAQLHPLSWDLEPVPLEHVFLRPFCHPP